MRVNICLQSSPSTSGPLPRQKNSRLFLLLYYKRSAIRQLCFYLQVLENCTGEETGMRVSRTVTTLLKLRRWTENKSTNFNHCKYEKYTRVQKETKHLIPLSASLVHPASVCASIVTGKCMLQSPKAFQETAIANRAPQGAFQNKRGAKLKLFAVTLLRV